MNTHPLATAMAAAVVGRDSGQLAAAVTDTVRLRALLPGGPIQAIGRDAVVGCFNGWFGDMDTVDLVESAGQAVADRRRSCRSRSVCRPSGCRAAPGPAGSG